MAAKTGTWLFKFSILLAIPPIVTCLAIYFIFGGPPPTAAADASIKILLSISIAQAIVAILSIVALSSDVKSISYFLICDLGLLLVFGSCIYTSFMLQNIKMPIKCMTHFTQEHFRENGRPPPFLDTIQLQLGCCGITGPEDYVPPILAACEEKGRNPDEFPIFPESCCINDDSDERARCRAATAKYVRMLTSSGSGLREKGSNLSPKYLPLRTAPDENPLDTAKLHVYKRGCGPILNSTENFMVALPNNYWRWAFLPLQLKNGYLRLMVIWSALLLIVFNYRAIQSRRSLRRPALVPRAPPMTYDNYSAHTYPFLPPEGFDININLVPKHKPEMDHHPFMLSAMVQPRLAALDPSKLVPTVVTDCNNNNSVHEHCPHYAASHISGTNNVTPCNNAASLPSAPPLPPPPYPFP